MLVMLCSFGSMLFSDFVDVTDIRNFHPKMDSQRIQDFVIFSVKSQNPKDDSPVEY